MKPLQIGFAKTATDKSICATVYREVEDGTHLMSRVDGENDLANRSMAGLEVGFELKGGMAGHAQWYVESIYAEYGVNVALVVDYMDANVGYRDEIASARAQGVDAIIELYKSWMAVQQEIQGSDTE